MTLPHVCNTLVMASIGIPICFRNFCEPKPSSFFDFDLVLDLVFFIFSFGFVPVLCKLSWVFIQSLLFFNRCHLHLSPKANIWSFEEFCIIFFLIDIEAQATHPDAEVREQNSDPSLYRSMELQLLNDSDTGQQRKLLWCLSLLILYFTKRRAHRAF